jgi:hypothetical protein
MTNSSKKLVVLRVAALALLAGCKKETPPVPPLAATNQMAKAAVVQRGFHPPVGHGRKDTAGNPITVDVSVADNAIVVNPTAPPTSETILAEFTNEGPLPEFVYKFLPSSQAKYHLFVEPSLDPSSHTTAFKIWQIPISGDSSVFMSGGLYDCADHHSNSAPEVGFKKCGRPMAAMPNKANPKTVISPPMKKSEMFSNPLFTLLYRGIRALIQPNDTTGRDPTDPAWIACSDGCCTVNAS